MTPLWLSGEVEAALCGEVFGCLPKVFHGVSIDSRSTQKNDLFFAIKGPYLDGHEFAIHAFDMGAGALVIDRAHSEAMKKIGCPLIIVEDVLGALGKLAVAARLRSRAKIVAITGSVGKTTTKEALKLALQASGKVHANPASFNNLWGVPLTLARLPRDADFAIFEIGMNHAGEIRSLVHLVQPHLALITLIAGVHLEHFRNIEAIARAKAEIFEAMAEHGQAILNADDRYFPILKAAALANGINSIRTFGESEGADYRLIDCNLLPQCSCFKMIINKEEAFVKIGAPGRHIVQDCLAVIGACDMLQADVAKAAMALTHFHAESGRGARYRLQLPTSGAFTLIDESYNANPTSMRAALDLLAQTKVDQGRHIAVLGDMLELGEAAPNLHRELIEPIRAAGVQMLFLVGCQMKHLALLAENEIHTLWRQDVSDLSPLVINEIRKDDVIMIKSSNSVGTQQIVQQMLAKFSPQNESIKDQD